MILKISRNYAFTNAGWYVYDRIVDVDYSNKMSGISSNETLADSWLKGDGDTRYEGSSIHKYFPPIKEHFEDRTPDGWIRLLVRFEDGRREEWIVQAETYLLNDEGKTIERIF